MRVKTRFGNITAPAAVFGVFILAIQNAAKYERSIGHLTVCSEYLDIAEELKEGFKNAGK